MSQNIRATPASVGRHGRTENVVGSGIAIMSDSSIALKPVIDEPSKPIPCSSASASSVALIENDLSWPRMSVNQSRMKRMSRFAANASTSSAVCGGTGIIGRERYWLGGGLRREPATVASILAAVRAHVALLALLVLLVAAGATAVSEAARSSRAQIAT